MTTTMDWSCNNCFGEGEINFPYNPTQSASIICSACNHISAYLWCNKCGFGGQIAKGNLIERPLNWACVNCKNEYPLPKDFFDSPIIFTPIAFSSSRPGNKFDLISINWLRRLLVLWDNYRLINIVGIFIGTALGLMKFLPENINVTGGVVAIFLLPIQVLLDTFSLFIVYLFKKINYQKMNRA